MIIMIPQILWDTSFVRRRSYSLVTFYRPPTAVIPVLTRLPRRNGSPPAAPIGRCPTNLYCFATPKSPAKTRRPHRARLVYMVPTFSYSFWGRRNCPPIPPFRSSCSLSNAHACPIIARHLCPHNATDCGPVRRSEPHCSPRSHNRKTWGTTIRYYSLF